MPKPAKNRDIPLIASTILGIAAIIAIAVTLVGPRGTGVPAGDVPESAVLSYEDPAPIRAKEAPESEDLDFVRARGRLRASWALRDVPLARWTSRVGILELGGAFELWGKWYCIEHEGRLESEASGADVTVVLIPPKEFGGDPRQYGENLFVWNAPVGPRLWWDEDIRALVVHDMGGYVDLPHAHRDVLEVVSMNAGSLQGWTALAVDRIEPYAPEDTAVFVLAVKGEISGSDIDVQAACAGTIDAGTSGGAARGQSCALPEPDASRVSAVLKAAQWYEANISACLGDAPADGLFWIDCGSRDEARETSDYLKALSASGVRVRLDGKRVGCDDPEVAYGVLSYIRFGRGQRVFSR